LPKNSLRQPVVEKIINQMINVVNAIIDAHGKPHEIRLELARELKQSKDERDAADKSNINNKKQNDLIAVRLEAMGLPATKKYIQKYKFIFPTKDKKWKEADVVNQCIYCGETFNLTEALREIILISIILCQRHYCLMILKQIKSWFIVIVTLIN
jgi:CRISPR-associated endonuclease Csn1